MGQQSSIKRLPLEIQELIGSLRKQGRTIDEILDHLKALDIEGAPSRSAMGRHVKSMEIVSERIRRSDSLARVMVDKLDDAPESKAARLNIQLIHSVILDIITKADEEGDGEGTIDLTPQQAMVLAKAIDHLGKAEKANVDVVTGARKLAIKQAADTVEEAAASKGLNAETAAFLRNAVLGVRDRAA